MPDWYQEITLQSVEELTSGQKRPSFPGGDRIIFRGQRADFDPETSLERACIRAYATRAHAIDNERALIREFQRRVHHFAAHVPPPEYELEWLSLIQHHGAPTRLLDWTYSL